MSLNESGYNAFSQEQKHRLERITKEWLVPLNKLVRITLTYMQGEYMGRLSLREYPQKINRKKCGSLQLRLCLADCEGKLYGLTKKDYIDFTSNEIERWDVLKSE